MWIKWILNASNLLSFLCLFLCACTYTEESKHINKVLDINTILSVDTTFVCDTTKIGKLVWMAEDLQVETFRNGDSIKKVTSYEEWKEAEDTNIPAVYIINIDKEEYQELINSYICNRTVNSVPSTPKNTTYYLYNSVAISDKRGLAPKGWKIPHYTDWDYLLDYISSEKDLLSENEVVESFGNPYNFSLKPTPVGLSKGNIEFDLTFAEYWALEKKLICLYVLRNNYYDFNFPRIWHEHNSPKYSGLCVRCIKE